LTGRRSKRRVESLVSAGGVVYRQSDGRIEAVLCGRSLPGGSEAERIRWSLAKGTPDAGETMEETALREVREETGLEVEMDSPLGAIEYWFVGREPDVRYHKTVHFYLMVPIGGGIELHDPEFDVVRWFSSDEALQTLAYANEVEVLGRALKLISSRKKDGLDG
jgi:8-oxo-dGTP pyrophosphatase MutT (NUDIX family)